MEITNTVQLKEAISILKAESEVKKEILIGQFHQTCNSLRPINLIKTAFNKVTDSPGIANRIINTSLGLGAGILSKKLLVGKSTNIFKRVFGAILELTVANVVAKNADGIKQQGTDLIKKLQD